MLRPALWCGALVSVCFATQNAPPQFRARTDLVTLDVAVLYPDRRPVRGLEARHFVVLEDGVDQPIETFGEVELPPPNPLPDGWRRETASDVIDNADDPSGRLVAIVLDDGDPKMTPAVAAAAQRVARDVIERLSPGDRGAIIFSRQRHLSSVVTTDHPRLLAAVKRFTVDRKYFSVPDVQVSAVSAAAGAATAVGTAQDRRKVVIFVSTGALVDMSKEMFDGDASVYDAVERAVAAADRDNVSIYAVDPTALLADPPALSPKEEKQRDLRRDFLDQFTEWAFGFAVVDGTRYEGALDRIFREHTSYYTLGYRTPIRKDNRKPPAVEVRVRRQGVLVRARTTRVDDSPVRGQRPPKPPDGPASAKLLDTQQSALPQSDVPLRLAAAVFRVPGKNEGVAAMTVAVSRPDASDAGDDTINVAVKAFQPFGPTRTRNPPTDYLTAPVTAAGPWELQSVLTLKPGYQRIELGAEHVRLGRMGSVRMPLDVPDYEKARLAVSGVVVNIAGDRAVPMPAALAGIVPFAPTTRRSFDDEERVRVFLQVYTSDKPPLTPVTLRSHAEDATGTRVSDIVQTLTREHFGPRGTANVTFEPALRGLAPGPYLLTIAASRDGTVIRRDVRIEIR